MNDDVDADAVARVYELINAAEWVPNGHAAIAEFEEAIAAADATGDLHASFDARVGHLQACTFGGAADRAIVSFAWCLARHDAEPDRFPSLNWQYKWIIHGLPEFAAVPVERIEEAFVDMDRRYRAAGEGDLAVVKLRWLTARKMGDLAAAERWFSTWQERQLTEGRDRYSDCRACNINDHAQLLAELGRHDEAVEVAAPIIAGEARCAEIPHLTFGMLLRSMVAIGREDTAQECHQRGYDLVRANPEYVISVAHHADYLRWAGRHDEAVDIIDRHESWLDEVRSDVRRVVFLAVASRVLGAAASFFGSGTEHLAERADVAAAAAREIAEQLDRRNGNTYYRSLSEVDPYAAAD